MTRLMAVLCGMLCLIAPERLSQDAAQSVEISVGEVAKAFSPDRKWELDTPPLAASGVMPWLVLRSVERPQEYYQKWPLQRSTCYVLWAPNSKAFVVTDPEYADHYLIRVFSTEFHLEGNAPGSPAIDLSVPLETWFRKAAARSYPKQKFDVDRMCPKALRWLDNDRLLVGLNARTYAATNKPGPIPGIRDWYRAYVIEITSRRIVRDLDSDSTRNQFGLELRDQRW